jgi:RNA polymerase sigma factor (sigma-70 family)
MKYELTTNDQSLIEKCLAGEEAAWETLIAKYERLIFSTCRRYGLQQTEAEDIFSRVCLALLQHLDKLNDRGRLASWLITITSRECWQLRKVSALTVATGRGKDDNRTQGIEEVEDETLLPEEVLLQLEQQQQVREGFNQLQERCRRLLWFLFYDPTQPSYNQIASSLAMPVASIGPSRARCLEKLRIKLKNLEGNQPL